MRALFYVGERNWTGCARSFATAARGLAARGHQVLVACAADTIIERRARADGLEVLVAPSGANVASDAWWLRSVLRERFVEVVYVHTEREQFAVSGAVRLAERGAVIRRVPAFQTFGVQRTGRLAMRLASSAVLFTTADDRDHVQVGGRAIPSVVAPLGIDVACHEEVQPASRASLSAPSSGVLIVCPYDPRARLRLATALRTLALLAPRHPEIHLVVVGPGSLDAEAQMHAAALGVSPLVSFLGERDDAAAVLRAADVAWIVAEHDDAAWALLDAMAMRIPVLADRSPLTQHYVADGVAGSLLVAGDPSYTASTVASFLADADRRTAMGVAGRVRVQREFPEAAMFDGFERAAQEAGDRSKWAVR